MELGEEIDHFFDIMKQQTNNDYIAFINKEFLNEEKWKSAQKSNKEMTDWNTIQDVVLINRTTEEIPLQNFRLNLQEIPEGGKVINKKLKINDKIYVLGVFPIYDAGNRKVGGVYFVHDISKIHQQMKSNIYTTSGLYLFILIVYILLIVFIIKRSIVQPIKQMEDVAVQVSEKQIFKKIERL